MHVKSLLILCCRNVVRASIFQIFSVAPGLGYVIVVVLASVEPELGSLSSLLFYATTVKLTLSVPNILFCINKPLNIILIHFVFISTVMSARPMLPACFGPTMCSGLTSLRILIYLSRIRS